MKYTFPKLSLFLSVLLLLTSTSLFVYLYGKVQTKHLAAQEAWSKWQTEAERRSSIQEVEDSIVKTTQLRAELDSHFAQSSNVVPFLDMIEQSGKSVGALTEVTGVELAKDNSGLIVKTDSEGSFEAIYKFLKLLENSPYELEFRILDMRSINAEGGSRWQASFEVKLLSFIK
jgi:hypothetical protein